MQFEPIFKGNRLLALSHKGENFDFIFGTRYLSFQNLQELYPALQFHRLKQVHGNNFLEVKKEHFLNLKGVSKNRLISKEVDFISSDAHWTRFENVFLSIQTADCIPILVSSENRVAAIHAGWKGLLQGLLVQLMEDVFSRSVKSKIKVALGPHIQNQSFEVKKDVRNQIALYYKKYFSLKGKLKPIFFPHRDLNKCFVSLKNLCLTELLYFGLSPENIFLSNEDTFFSSHYFSYRRDGGKKGFQISGVLKRKRNQKKDKSMENQRRRKQKKLG